MNLSELTKNFLDMVTRTAPALKPVRHTSSISGKEAFKRKSLRRMQKQSRRRNRAA